MDKKELTENLGKASAGDRNQDPAMKAVEKETEERKQEAEHEPGMLEKLGKTQTGAIYEDPAMKETERKTETEKED
ncbi:hypothetical protein [Enterococcus xiangfangensis]|uniref:Uncharacterized protein n=1 Tax=Enterococcus xiangfangensis TaxID=1296537 RepID=A0ABU3FCD7_9ENTE|nr:hypothetical protein [Enterococcus xiangfangensis]MDT2760321.1 hypothetical protein [Enterococcus xiangfangensis]